MIPVHRKPLLEYIINGIINTGIKDFIIVVGYRKEQIIDYFQDGFKWSINIQYIEQEELNGTGGALLLCEDSIENNHFLLSWGDILVPYKIYKNVYQVHQQENEDFILVSNYLEDLHRGCEIHCEGNYCIEMVEKPPKGAQTSNLNNSGIFIFSKEIFELLKMIKPSKRGEIEIPDAIRFGIKERNWKVRVIKMEKNQFRGDFGDKEVYENLIRDDKWLEELYK